jgi:hypothetical protein
MSKIIFDEELDRRINRARLAGDMHGYTIAEFTNYLLDIGLTKYEKSILPLEQGDYSGAMEARLQAAGCETAPEAVQRTETKIIPFPGVSLPEPDGFQNGLDDFLREMGYIE